MRSTCGVNKIDGNLMLLFGSIGAGNFSCQCWDTIYLTTVPSGLCSGVHNRFGMSGQRTRCSTGPCASVISLSLCCGIFSFNPAVYTGYNTLARIYMSRRLFDFKLSWIPLPSYILITFVIRLVYSSKIKFLTFFIHN